MFTGPGTRAGRGKALKAIFSKIADGTILANFSGRLARPTATTPDAANIQRTYYASSTSGTSTYTATLAPVPTAYVTGAQYVFTVTSTNTGASTMNFNSLGAKTIQLNGSALLPGQLVAGATYQSVYDGTNLQITGTSSPIYVFPTNYSMRYGWADSDDFVIRPYNVGTAAFGSDTFGGKTIYTIISGASGGPSFQTYEKGHPGIAQVNAGTSNGSGRTIFYSTNGLPSLDHGGGSDMVWYIKTDATLSSGTTRYQLTGGWSDNTFTGSANNRAIWSYIDNESSGVFTLKVTSNSVLQTAVVGTTTVLASTWYRLRININAAYSAITLYISVGTVSGGVTTWAAEYQDCQYTGTMPVSTAGYYISTSINKTVGTGNSNYLIDGWEAAIYLASPRGG